MENNNKRLLIIGFVIVLIILGGIYFYNNSNKINNNQISSNVINEQNSSPSTEMNNNEVFDNSNTINSVIGPQTYIVDIVKMKVVNKTITIKKGDSVMWVNYDNVPHRLMSELGSEISSKAFYKNQNWTHQFDDSGTYDYYCTVYPYVKGTVIVQ